MNNTANITKEPFIRIVKRGSEGVSGKKVVGIRAASILLALVIDAVFIVLVTGLNPIAVYADVPGPRGRKVNVALDVRMQFY